MIYLSPDATMDVERIRSFLEPKSPAAARRALSAIWQALAKVEEFPDLGMRTQDAEIRQLVIRFGSSAYIVRYAAMQGRGIMVTRIWHGRETRE